MNAEEYVLALESIGWFADVSPEEVARLRTQIPEFIGRDPEYAFVVLAIYSFDVECIDTERPYATVLQGLADASWGRFVPTEIDESVEQNRCVVTFRHQGRPYEVSVTYEDDMFQGEAIDLVNQSLADSGIQNRFEPLPPFDQIVYLTFVSQASRDAAVERGLIPNVPHLFGKELEEQ